MNDGLEELRAIGSQKIHEQTHIVREQVQALLHETFDDISKIQFLGFISILQREYGVDLSDLRKKGQEFYDERDAQNKGDLGVFMIPTKKKKSKLPYFLLAIVLFGVFIVFKLDLLPGNSINEKSKIYPVDNSAIEVATESIEEQEVVVADTNVTIVKELNTTKEIVKVTPPVEKKVVLKSFKIIPKSRLWLGYIDLNTHKKYQRTFSKEFDLNASKDWLLAFGHGYVKIELNGELVKFKVKTNFWLLYKDAKLTKITQREFKKLNKGSRW